MPGLVDMHVHTWFEAEQLLFLTYGVTTVRCMSGTPRHLTWRDQIAAGERLGPTIFSAGVWNCPTIVVMQKWLDESGVSAELDRPHLRWVPPASIAFWQLVASGQDDELLHAGREATAARIDLVRALHEGGARLLVGTDSGHPWVVAGFSIHEELANFVDAGLSPYEALCAATRSAAECLGAQDEFGTVAPGHRAELLLLDGNPLQDASEAAAPVGVMTRGRWLPGRALRARLDQLTVTHRASLAQR